MNRKSFIKLAGLSIAGISIPFKLLSQQSDNPYLDEFNKLPLSYHRNDEALIHYGEKYRESLYGEVRNRLVTKYSWAVPTETAIDAITKFVGEDALIDFGAGSGYWASLIANKKINIIAVDNWIDGKPDLWYDVQTGSYEYLKFAGDRVLFMCWIPQHTDMGLTALKTWNGDKFIMVGESPARGNANSEFFEYLAKHYLLIKEVSIPQWYNRDDAVFFYKRKR